MIKFCSCGSIMVDDQCTNKNCSLHKSSSKKSKRTTGSKSAGKTSDKSTGKTKNSYDKARRSSRCITYSLEELENKKES